MRKWLVFPLILNSVIVPIFLPLEEDKSNSKVHKGGTMSSIWKWLNQGTYIGGGPSKTEILGYTIKNPYRFKISRLFWGMELLLIVVFIMASEYMWAAIFAILGVIVAVLVYRAKGKE